MKSYNERTRVILFSCLALLAWQTGETLSGTGAVALAETVEARTSATILSGPGEQNRMITRVRAGDKMTVLNTQGRWYKVRVKGRTGWIARSQVVGMEAAPKARRPRRSFVEGRGKSRKPKKRRSAPRDRVGADTIIEEDENHDNESLNEAQADSEEEDFDDEFDEEDDEAPEASLPRLRITDDTALRLQAKRRSKRVVKVRSGDTVYQMERRGSWLRVETEDGDEGWILAKKAEVSGGLPKLQVNLSVGARFHRFAQNFTSNGQGDLANTATSAAAAGVQFDGEVLMRITPKVVAAVDLSYGYAKAIPPGIQATVNMQRADIGYQRHEVDAGARAGYLLSPARTIIGYARLGYRYENFAIDDATNLMTNIAQLPTENLSGITIGASLDVARLSEKLAVRLGVDYLGLLGGTREQTAGLEDGATVPSLSALLGHVRLRYQWKPDTKIVLGYDYQKSDTEWSGAAVGGGRATNATQASRQDTYHTGSLSLGRSF